MNMRKPGCNIAENVNKKSRRRSCDEYPFLPFSTDDSQSVLPAAGYRNGTDVNNQGSNGNYWSGTLNSNNSNNAYNLNFNSNNVNNWNNNNRYNGQSVRPVTELISTLSPCLKLFHLTKELLLVDLFKAYKNARKHKRRTVSQLRFEMNMEAELVSLRNEIWERRYVPRTCVCFIIEDPKKREIFAADFRDRVVHHLYYNYTYELFERSFITDSYSCRIGKGTHYGINRLKHYIRQVSQNYTRPCFVLKLDIKGYFMNIDRRLLLEVCLDILYRMSNHLSDVCGKKWAEKLDYNLLYYLTDLIVMNDPLQNCRIKGKLSDWEGLPDSKSLFKTPEGCGLPIGNLTSQLFSNVFMNRFDQFMKRELKETAYGRYVDDSFVVGSEKATLKKLIPYIRRFLKDEMHLTLHPQKLQLVNAFYGMEFLGTFVKPYRTYVSNGTLKRMKRKIRLLHHESSSLKIRSSLNSDIGVLSHFSTYNIRRSLFYKDHFWYKWGYFGRGFLKYSLKANRKLSQK